MAIARVIGLKKIKIEIPANTTLDVDTVALSKFKVLQYSVTCHSGNLTKGLEMKVVQDNSLLFDTVYGRTGSLPLAINATIEGSNGVLKITNPNASLMHAELLKVSFGTN